MCIAPTLFNLYFGLVIEQWRTKCSEFEVDVLYKGGRGGWLGKGQGGHHKL